MTPLDGVASLVAAHLPPSRPSVAPGLAVTVYDRLADALPLLAQIRPDVVLVHATPTDRAYAAQLRATVPGVRLWYQVPANYLAAGDLAADVETVRGYVRGAIALGAEVLSLNGEGASAPGRPGWAVREPSGRAAALAALAERATTLLAAAADESAGRLALAWSSHDCPLWHPLPWGALYGPASPVSVSLHQHYPADGDAPASRAACLSRLATSSAQWSRLGPSACRPELAPGGASAVLYTQAHGLSVEGACALYDRSALAAAWALPTRHDPAGILALRADAELRRRVGHAPGRVARWQTLRGLTADGVVGARTLASLGIA